MTQRLIIYLDETWPAEPSAPWVLLDARDAVVEEGRSEPSHWPAAADCELVLGGAQCAWLEARLPKAARRERERLLPYALESQLLHDVDAQHLVPTHYRSDDDGLTAGVLVVSRARLRTLLAQLAALGRAPARAVAELQGVPQAPSHWTIALGPTGGAVLRLDAARAFAADRDTVAELLCQALQQLGPDADRPTAIEVRTAAGITQEAVVQAADVAPTLPIESGPAYRWWEACANGTELLTGEFAPAHRGGANLRALRRPLALGAFAAALFVVANLATVLWQRHQLAGLDDRMQRVLGAALPGAPAIAPALQLRRALDEARAQHGELREDDLLALLAAYSEIRASEAGASVAALDYDGGRLELTLEPASAAGLDRLAARFAALGYAAGTERAPAPILTLSRSARP